MYFYENLLVPFLFLLVVEGLSASIRMVEDLRGYVGFQVGSSGLLVSHLMYVNDTPFIGEASMANLWALKTFMCLFGLASGLMVNFF